MKVAIVTSDLKGPIKCGGVGTAYSELATTLVAQGHEVTIFFLLIPGRPVKDFVLHQRRYQKNNIRLEVLKNPAVAVDGPEVVREAYAVYLNLKGLHFDLIHFPDMHGLGYYCLAAKRLGQDFQETQFAVILNGPSHWHKWGNQQFFNSLIDLQYLYLERKCVEWADYLISPSQHALNWAENEGWRLPQNTQVIQYPYTAPLVSSLEGTGIQEIVFFGRLETRKGLDIFIHSLETLEPSRLQGKKVVFLGKGGLMGNSEPAVDFLQRRSKHWSFHWELKSELGQEEAIRYLISKNALAVIPSRDETLGYTVMECLANQIPFLALDIAPFRELIHPDDADQVLSTEAEFSVRLAEKLLVSQVSARFRIPPAETLQTWRNFHHELERVCFASRSGVGHSEASQVSAQQQKDLTVVILHQDRPEFLEQCLESLAPQNYDFNICIVDNASTQSSSRAYLQLLERDRTTIQVLRLPLPLHPSAARNVAAKAMKTEWILWLDDDNLLKPHAIEKLMNAALVSQAPFITAAIDCFESRKSPLKNTLKTSYRTIFMGSDPALGFFRNIFGDTSSLMSRRAFLDLGGFQFESNSGNEDWEFFIRAALKGLEIGVVPEALFWYRLSEDSRSKTVEAFHSERFRRRPYDSLVSTGWLRGFLDLSYGTSLFQLQDKAIDSEKRRSKELAAHLPILGSVEEDLYQDRVQCLGNLVFEAGPSTDFGNIKQLWHCRLEKVGNSLAVIAEGFDPAIEIQVPSFVRGGRLRLDVEIEVPRATQLQIFYKVAEHDNYHEKRSLLTQLRPGHQEVSVLLPETCIGGALRIDPVCEQLNSKVQSLRLYTLDELALEVAVFNDHPNTLFELRPTSEDPERSPEL